MAGPAGKKVPPIANAKQPVKPSPGAKAAALQQAAANKQFAATQKANAKTSTPGRSPVVNAQTGFVTGTRAVPRTQPKPPGKGYQPPRSGFPRPPAGGKNPIEKLLTPGGGGIANAMTGGLRRKGGALTRSGR